MKKLGLPMGLFLIALLLAGCVAGPNELAGTPDKEGDVAGFWQGLWNGIIAPVTFVLSLFIDTIKAYDVHNNGGWYDFGFLLGVSIIFGGGGRGSARRRRS
jgi:hypothetical protein